MDDTTTTDPGGAVAGGTERGAPAGALALGKVAAPPNKEATSELFYFWVAHDRLVERTQIVTTSSTLGGKGVTFVGLVEEVYRQSRQHDMGEEVDRFDGNTSPDKKQPPFASAGFGYARTTILRTEPLCHAPPVEESTVYLGGAADAAKGYGFDRMRPESALAVGLMRNGGTEFAGPALIDLAYLLGENGGHLNVNGIAGMGTKSSFLLHVVKLLLAWAKRVGKPGDTGRVRVIPIIFNVKNFDLFFIDRPNRNWKPEHASEWEQLGVEPEPFREVQFFAPQQRADANPIRTGRDGVTAYSWGLADVIEHGLFRYLFADDDLGSPNFGGLVSAIEDRLTRDTPEGPKLRDGAPQTFDELPDWISDSKTHAELGAPHTGTRSALVRRLRGLLLDSDGVLRRDKARGMPLEMPRDEVSGPWVIDLFGVRDQKVQRFVVAAVLKRLIDLRSNEPVEGMRYVIALDELNRFAPKGGTDPITLMIERVAAEMRSQGIILLGAQQEASRVSPRVIENAAVRAVGRSGALELSADVWKFLGPAARSQAAQLQETDKLVVLPSFRAPMLVKVPFPPWALRKEEAAGPPTVRVSAGDDRFATDTI
jgi:uncharacterized protein